ncbi:hypothetical protein P8T57_16795 [Thalassospira sp. SN3W]|uniref:hypothetical protein n=1 Tax=Thalassospira sp. SN3W TaxID=3035476 RepID=UPI00311B3BA7
MRGLYRNVLGTPFENTEKTLHISLIETKQVWHQIILDELNGEKIRKSISNELSDLKEKIRNFSDRQIIYFISRRPRVRLYKPIKYSFFGNTITIPIEIGENRKRRKLRCNLSYLDSTGKKHRPSISSTSKLVRLGIGDSTLDFPISIFLQEFGIDLGICSEITYIGRTDDPKRRVIDGNHRGLSDTLSMSLDSGDDVFVHFNLFHARYHSEIPEKGIHFLASNSLLDYVEIKEEAEIIEKLFINYFRPSTQSGSKSTDSTRLKKSVSRLNSNKNVKSIIVSCELNNSAHDFNFFTPSISPRKGHIFQCELIDKTNLSFTTLEKDPIEKLYNSSDI